ncbi:hypothetical protein [Shewanella waksmanii]|uniref:hypothetical protein n=1 Tax=Shewanella waksmanii TaxID=213783 RepID=UPI0037366BEF
MNKTPIVVPATHFSIKERKVDTYQLLTSKSERISWNLLSDTNLHVDKQALIKWFYILDEYSDEAVKKILVEGILESQFNNITFIFTLAQMEDFEKKATQDFYQFLYGFISETPSIIEEFVDEVDLKMSKDVLALLAKKR